MSSFDETILSLLEMAATFKDVGDVRQTISDIKAKNLPHHYQKPLVAIANDADRDEMIDRIIAKVFGSENHNPTINTKKELQDALEKAVIDVSREPDSKFNRPVQGVAANYLGRWLGSNINVEYTRSGDTELQNKGASVTAAKEVLTKTLTPTAKEKEEIEQSAPAAVTTEPKPTSGQASEIKAGDVDEETAKKIEAAKRVEGLEEEHSLVEAYYEHFLAQVATLNKKFAKDGIPQLTVQKTGEKMVDVKGPKWGDHGLSAPKLKKIKFKVQVPSLVVPGGWKFIGRVDHFDFGNLIVSVPGTDHKQDLHAMFGKSQPSHCDHCGRVKKRTATFVVLDENGKIQRFGRQCLRKYISGGEKAFNQMKDFLKLMSDIAEGLKQMEDRSYDTEEGGGSEGGGGGSRQFKEFGLNDAIGIIMYLFDKGLRFVSKQQAYDSRDSDNILTSTAEVILSVFDGSLQDRVERIVGQDRVQGDDKIAYEGLLTWSDNKEKYKEKLKAFKDWGIEQSQAALRDPNNQYREANQNLLTVLTAAKERKETYIPTRYLATLAGAVNRYVRHIEKQNADKLTGPKKVSEFVGVVGGAIGDLDKKTQQKMEQAGIKVDYSKYPYNGPIEVTVVKKPTAHGSAFGTSYRYSFMDDRGNKYTYFSSYDLDLDQGDKAKIVRAGVKKHETEYDSSTIIGGKTPIKTVIERI